MNDNFDPKAWNLFVGATVLAGCVDREVGGNDEMSASEDSSTHAGTESTTDTSTTEVVTTETDTTETETGYYEGCQTDDDCADSAVCVGGICLPPQYCMFDWHCPELKICVNQGCQWAGELTPSCGFPEFDIPVPLDVEFGTPRAMTFADLDDDGRDELVVVMEGDPSLRIFESGWNVPMVAMGCQYDGSYLAPAMAAGQFDDQPGEDIAYFADGIQLCFSDGAGGFASQSTEPSPLSHHRMIAGDFDGQPPMDLLPFGHAGATLHLLGNAIIPLSDGYLTAGAAVEFGTPGAGAAFLDDSKDLSTFDLTGSFQGGEPSIDNRRNLAGITSPEEARYAVSIARDAASQEQWYNIRLLDPDTLATDARVMVGDAFEMFAGDFDGDEEQDLFVTGDDNVTSGDTSVIFHLFEEPCLATQDLGNDSLVKNHAVGDHDGDGDDEIALIFDDQSLVIVDVE